MILDIKKEGIILYAELEKPKRQVNTLVGTLDGDIHVSGYGAVTPTYARIKDEDALLCGFRGGLILDNAVLGFSFTGLAYPNKREDFGNDSYTDNRLNVNFGYGGAMIEYYFFRKSLYISQWVQQSAEVD